MAKRPQTSSLKPSSSKENFPPHARRRFNFDVSDEDFEEFTKGYVPRNTMGDTQKCVRLFTEWMSERNSLFPDDLVPEDILTTKDKSLLCKWLCKFCIEVRKKDGSPYPPRSIHHYLLGIQRHIRTETKQELNVINDKEFLELKNLLDALFRKLHSAGVGTTVKRTPVLLQSDEEKLWSCGVLNPDTPQGLLNCVFFLNGKNFCLRGGVEHRELKLSQFTREVVLAEGKHLVRYTYTEYVSKNRSGGLKQIQQGNKTVHQYESENVERCHVLLLDKYFSKLPKEAKDKDIFYLKPKNVAPKDPISPWFTAVPIGKHTLQDMMKKMSIQADLDQSFTNHSLRAYGVSKLFQANVPEKLIMERSGHRSIEGVRKYERTGVQQELQVCNVLSSGKEPKKNRNIPNPWPTVSAVPSEHPTFSGCTFQNCTIQIVQPQPPILPTTSYPPIDDFSDIDLQDFFDF